MPPQRGQGQWALGHREPLNPNERVKRDDDALHVKQRILDRYQYTGFDSIDPADLRNRFRWFGLYTQRAPGIPGGRTAVLEPEELEDSYFMLRVRIDGGQLSADQLRVIGGISAKVLTEAVRRLEFDGLIERHDGGYALTRAPTEISVAEVLRCLMKVGG